MKLTITTALAIAALTATAPLAQTFEPYGEAGGWNVLANTKMEGCLLQKRVRDDIDVQLGLNKVDERGYLAFFAPIALGIDLEVSEPLQLEVDGDSYQGTAFDVLRQDYVGSFVWFNNPQFVYDLVEKNTLTLKVEGLEPLDLSLAGTKAGFEMLQKCQQEKFE